MEPHGTGGHRSNDDDDSEKHDLAVQWWQLADVACVDETPAVDDDGSSGTTEAEHDTGYGAIARAEAGVESGTALADVEDRQLAIPRSPRPRWADIDNEDAVSGIAAATSGVATGEAASEDQCSVCLGDPSSAEDHCCFCLEDGRAERCTCQDPPSARLGGGLRSLKRSEGMPGPPLMPQAVIARMTMTMAGSTTWRLVWPSG